MWQCVVCDTLWHTIWSMVSCDNVWYVTVIHYGTLYGPWSHVVYDCDALWHSIWSMVSWQCVVCNRDTLWHSIWSMVSCDNVWYVTVIHYGTLYGPWSHVTMCGMWPWYTMALYMVNGLMWQCVVCDCNTLWHSIWSMVSCDNVWYVNGYTMAHYMVHGLMWQCVVCDRDTLWHTIWSMVSCDNVWYVTVIHYGTLYGPWYHVTMCGMWYTMALYMVHGLMWQCVVCDRDTLWHSIWSMVSCDNVWYVTMIYYALYTGLETNFFGH